MDTGEGEAYGSNEPFPSVEHDNISLAKRMFARRKHPFQRNILRDKLKRKLYLDACVWARLGHTVNTCTLLVQYNGPTHRRSAESLAADVHYSQNYWL